METIIQYKYQNRDFEFRTFLSNETLGDLQELLLEKLNLSLVNISYIQAVYYIDNISYHDVLGNILYSNNLLNYLNTKDGCVFVVNEATRPILNRNHYRYMEYIRYRDNININNYFYYDIQYDNQMNNQTNNTNDNINDNNYTNIFSNFVMNTNNNQNSLRRNILTILLENLDETANSELEDVKIVLTNEEIEDLNQGLYKDLKINNDEYSCPISLKNIEDDDEVIKLPCDHIFCKEELLQWVKNESNKCPLCRNRIATGIALM